MDLKKILNGYPQKSADNIIKMIQPYDVVSFDVFDTLLKRDVESESDVFDLVERKYNSTHDKKIDKKVSISRVNGTHTFPSNFMFITAMNPCPCGYYPSAKCKCTDYEIVKYRGKISGPIMDRIDIQKEVHPVDFFAIADQKPCCSSEELRLKVKKARKIQQERYAQESGINCNAQMTTEMIQNSNILDSVKYANLIYRFTQKRFHVIIISSRVLIIWNLFCNYLKKLMCINMGMFVNPDNLAFQAALNARIYVDKSGILNYTNSVLGSTDAFICNSRPRRSQQTWAPTGKRMKRLTQPP